MPKNSPFKPIIASSLALALGVSVASAEINLYELDMERKAKEGVSARINGNIAQMASIDVASQPKVPNDNWETISLKWGNAPTALTYDDYFKDNQNAYKFVLDEDGIVRGYFNKNGTWTKGTLYLQFYDAQKYASGDDLTARALKAWGDCSGYYFTKTPNSINTAYDLPFYYQIRSTKPIELTSTASNAGLSIQYAQNGENKNLTLDLSEVKGQDFALKGSIVITGGDLTKKLISSNDHYTFIFGSDFQGDLTTNTYSMATLGTKTSKGTLNFLGSANWVGNLTASGGLSVVNFDQGDIQGTITANSSASEVDIFYKQANKTINNTTKLNLTNGIVSFGFDNSIAINQRVMTFNGNLQGNTGGRLKFNGVKSVNLEGGITLNGTSLEFNIDNRVASGSQIVDGDINLTGGTLFFTTTPKQALKRQEIVDMAQTLNGGAYGMPIYSLGGTATLNNAGISAFYDADSNSFVGKLSGNLIPQGGTLYNTNDFYLENSSKITYSNFTNANNSHIVFGGEVTFDGTENTFGSQGGSQIVFKENVEITGSIKATSGGSVNLIVANKGSTFGAIETSTNGKITLDLRADSQIASLKIGSTSADSAFDDARNTINFSGNTLTITSGVSTQGKYASRAINTINITQAGATLNINDLGITTKKTNYAHDRQYNQQNIINFTNGGNLSLNGEDKDINNSNFDGILALNGNKNTITFQGTGNASISAVDIQAKYGGSSNIINFQGTGTNTITSSITASDGGQNTISSKGTLVINGNINADSNTADTNKNIITADNATFSGNITAGYNGGGWLSQNLIVVNGRTTFSNENNQVIIKANQVSNTNTDKTNFFKLNGEVSGDIAEISSITLNSGNRSLSRNILSFDGDALSNLTIGNINKSDSIPADAGKTTYSSGYNYIGKNLISSSGSNLSLSFNEGQWKSEDYRANVNLTISNKIYAFRSGKNYINVNSLSGSGEIDGNGGTNNIITASNFSSGAIKTRWGGNNNILIGGNGTISSINAGDANDNTNTSNNITFFGADSQSVVVGNISIGNGTGSRQNNITLSGDNATLTLKGETNQITNFTAYATPSNTRSSGYSTLVIDGTTQANSTTISNVTNGENLVVKFNGRGNDNSATLKISGFTNGNTLKAITLGNASTNNTLDLTALSTIAITDTISVGANQGLNLNLLNTSLTLTGGLTTTDGGVSVINVGDTTTASASSTLLGGAINLATLNLNGATDSTSTLTLSNDSDVNSNVIGMLNANAKTNTLQATKGKTTIKNANVDADKSLTLSLSTDASTPHNTLVELENAINGNGSKNITFTGGINPADQIHHATLLLKAQDNQITSVSSSASNGVIAFQDTAGATIDSVTIDSIPTSTPSNPATPSTLSTSTTGGSLTFAFRGTGVSNVNVTNGITVGNGATLGISLGVTDESTQTISGNIDFQEGSTLLVDFLNGNKGNATITTNTTTDGTSGNGGIFIKENRNSIINFHGTNTGRLNGSGITIAGGNNTINFIGSATMSGVTLESGTNTINVYGAESQENAITGTIISSQLGSINNTINLNDYSILNLLSEENGLEGSGELKTTATNTLNFLGNNATLKGGFGLEDSAEASAVATVNVGKVGGADTDSVSGTIIGQVSNATLAFNAGTSKLTLQNLGGGDINHTFATITSNAKDGILVFDTSKGVVNAEITGATTIEENKSLSLDFQGKNNTTVTTTGGLTINGTLGIIINGDGEKKVTSDINLNGKGTLLVDFTSGTANVTLGQLEEVDGKQQAKGITIGTGESSIINFRGGEGVLANSLTLDGGTNTLNFFVNGNVGGIKLVSGSNNINVEDGITAKILDTSSVGSVNNTINLKEGAKLYLQADGSGSLNTTDGKGADGAIALSNTLNFNGADATLYGGFGIADGAISTATINVKNTGAKITGNVSNAGVNFSEVNNSTLTLQGATNTLKTLGSTTNITGTIILDTTLNDSVSAEITTAVASDSSVGLKFGSGSKAKTFKFSTSGNNLAGVEFDARGSKNNTLSFTSTGNSIVSPFEISDDQELIIDLKNGSDLSIAGLNSIGSGVANLQSTETTTLKGGDVSVAKFSLLGTTANAKMQNSNTTINSLLANGTTSNTLTLDGANSTNNSVGVGINSITGNLTAILNGSDTKSATLNLNGNATLSALKIGDSAGSANSTNNTLAINNGKTIISSDVSVGASQGISFSLANGAILEFGGDNTFTNSAGSTTFNIQGANTTLNGVINAKGGTTTLSMSDGSSLTLTNGLSTTGGATTINLAGTSSITGNISTFSGDSISTTLNYAQDNASLTLKNGAQAISALTLNSNSSTSALNLVSSTTKMSGNLELASSKTLNANIDGTSSLTLASVSTSGALRVDGAGSLSATGITGSGTSGSNNINVRSLTINGDLIASQGAQNTITADILTISGNISADSRSANTNKNTITANTATFLGSITAGYNDNGWLSQNFIDIKGDVSFTNSSIQAKNINNTNTAKTNFFKFGGAVSGTIAEVTSNSKNSSGFTSIYRTKNILSFDGSVSSTLTIDDINKSDSIGDASGYVYIGANINQVRLENDNSKDLVLNLDDSTWNSSNHTANLNLSVTNTIYAKAGGKNYINVASLTAGTIKSEGGTNNIHTAGVLTADSITSISGGVMNIIVGGNAEIASINAGSESGNGANNITFAGANSKSVVKGDIQITGTINDYKKNNLTLQGSGATLTLKGKDSGNTTHTVTKLDASGENTTLVLDNSGVTDGVMTTTINTLSNGNNLTATLKGQGVDKSATLALNGGALKALTLGENSTGNILDLSNATAEMSITNQINVGNGQDLTIKLKNTTLTLNGGLNTNGGTSTLELVADDSSASSVTLTGGAIALSNLTLGATNNTLILNNAKTTIASALDVSSNSLALSLGDNSTLVLGSSTNTITSLSSNGGLIDLSQGVKLAGSAPSTDDSLAQSPALVLLARGLIREGEGSEVVTTPDTQNPSTDSNAPQAPSVDSQPSAPSATITSKDARNTLTINNRFTGTATFKLYANSNTADRVVFKAPAPSTPEVTPPTEETTPPAQGGSDPVTGTSIADGDSTPITPAGKAIIAITGDSSVYDIKFDENGSDNIMVADTTGANGTVAVEGGESMIGVSTAVVNLVERNGQYFIGDVIEGELNQSLQAIASSALAVNYDLYLANFNSLNKRMGELRNGEDNNGVWARVFGGNMSNSFGAGSKTDYITVQAGYDYSLSVGNNARNFIGIAVAYGTSNTKSNTLEINAIGTPFANIALDKVSSNMVEVGLYNSYVADNGWYNDTILKFDYIMSEFSLSNDPSTMSKTNNFAMVLSDEFGYRYSFGVSEKGSWYIDPQAELAFGYFNQSDFNRAVLNSDKVPANLQASQDAILTLRSRIGATLGKKFITDKGFAGLYFGASYEYDHIEGGNSEVGSGNGRVVTQLDKVESNGRAVLNVGSNIELTKGARLYIDVEKSFGDKQRTFMQFNLGARYSF